MCVCVSMYLSYIYIYIYIYCHPQTDCFVVSQLFSVAKHVGRLSLGSKPAQIYVRLSIIPLSQQANHVSSGIIRHYVVAFVCLHFCLTGYQSAQFIRRVLYYSRGSRQFLRQSAQLPWGSLTFIAVRNRTGNRVQKPGEAVGGSLLINILEKGMNLFFYV